MILPLASILLLLSQALYALDIKVGVDWQLCDLEAFHAIEHAFAISDNQGWSLLKTGITRPATELFKLMQAANYYAAKAQLYATIQPVGISCDAFTWDGTNHACGKLLEDPTATFEGQEWDHQHGPGKADFVLYASLSSSALPSLVKLAMDSGRPFIFRPLTNHPKCQDKTDWLDLSKGVIAEFEAKSEEYNAAGGKGAKKPAKLELPAELAHLKKAVLEIDYKIPLPDVNDMALKIAQVALESKEPLRALETITCNYPVLQKALNGVKLSKDLAKSVEAQQKRHASTNNALRVNNLDVSMEVGDWYRWLQLGLEFERLVHATKLSIQEIADWFGQQDESMGRTVYRLEPEGVIFLNDLEKDAAYAQWPRNLENLLVAQAVPQHLSQLKFLRRNLVTVVAYIPWGHLQLVELLSEWGKTVQQRIPMRLGFQVTAGADPKDAEPVRVFYKLQATTTLQDAFKFMALTKQTQKSCDEALQDVLANKDTTCAQYAESFTLSPSCYLISKLTMWLNGKMSEFDMMQDMVGKLAGLYQTEMQRFVEAVKAKDLTDDTLLDDFLFDARQFTVLPSYLPGIESFDLDDDNSDKTMHLPDPRQCPEKVKCRQRDGEIVFGGYKVRAHPHIDLKRQAAMLVDYATGIKAETVMRPQVVKRLKTFKIDLKQTLLPMISEGDGRPIQGQMALRISLGEPTASAIFHVQAMLNPTSRFFPRTLIILLRLKRAGLVSGELYLNPAVRINDYPFRDFYSLDSRPPKLTPLHALLAVKVDTPVSWIVVQHRTSPNIDADNVRLQDTQSAEDEVVFALKHLVVEGQFLEASKHVPAAGLQLTLLDDNAKAVVDQSIVMANFGYFQLKCHPGTFHVQDQLTETRQAAFAVQHLTLPMLLIKAKLPSDWHSRINSQTQLAKAKEDDDRAVNIFSIASGLAYERLIRIMMASVCENRKERGRKVKFWLFDSYVSPLFRQSIRILQKQLGFEYEFVSYKWPAWLHAQKTKMRTVWAYKVLFLDLLFPLPVKRVIYLDADQVARADLAELSDLDMDEHVYGMVPFCEDKPDMAAYRFWRSAGGFWEQYLQGKPYHISALFVADLERLRATMAGDVLRAQYHLLANDPHSLSNLDQDLPNSLQHRIPIFSLPSEWLWCDTWCSAKTKQHAKVIDLCNNPKSKADKLAAAPKIIPEWTRLDKHVEGILQQAHRLEL